MKRIPIDTHVLDCIHDDSVLQEDIRDLVRRQRMIVLIAHHQRDEVAANGDEKAEPARPHGVVMNLAAAPAPGGALPLVLETRTADRIGLPHEGWGGWQRPIGLDPPRRLPLPVLWK